MGGRKSSCFARRKNQQVECPARKLGFRLSCLDSRSCRCEHEVRESTLHAASLRLSRVNAAGLPSRMQNRTDVVDRLPNPPILPQSLILPSSRSPILPSDRPALRQVPLIPSSADSFLLLLLQPVYLITTSRHLQCSKRLRREGTPFHRLLQMPFFAIWQ